MKDTLTLMKIVFITAPSNPIRSRHKRCARRRPARTHVAAIFDSHEDCVHYGSLQSHKEPAQALRQAETCQDTRGSHL